MLSTTDAIVLCLQPQSDKAHVLHTYTRAGGRVNYKVYGLGRKNTAGKYTPLSILQLTTDERSVRTAHLLFVPQTLVTDPYKRTIALFISEILHNVLRHPMVDEPMFDFLVQSIKELDSLPLTSEEFSLANFHLQFLIDFAAKLGFAMESEPSLPHTREERQKQLRSLCSYFEEHVETWQTPHSLDVLMEVFD